MSLVGKTMSDFRSIETVALSRNASKGPHRPSDNPKVGLKIDHDGARDCNHQRWARQDMRAIFTNGMPLVTDVTRFPIAEILL